MAQSITNAFVTLFDAEVKQAYQGESVLLGAVRLRQGVQGNTYKFPKLGKGSATARIPQTDVTPLNVTYSQVTATMEDYNAAGTHEQPKVKIADTYFQSSGFGRILDDHNGDRAKPHAEYEDPGQGFAEKL